MTVPVTIVRDRSALRRFRDELLSDRNVRNAFPLRRGRLLLGRADVDARVDRRENGHFKRRESAPRVAVANRDEQVERVLAKFNIIDAQSAVAIGDGAADEILNVVVPERLELKDAASAQKRVVNRKKRIFRRRADKNDDALFDLGKEDVLLRLIETVYFVNE